MKDCNTAHCYNETGNKNGYCFDCLNRKKEELAQTGAHWLHVEYPSLYDRRGCSINKKKSPLSDAVEYLMK